MTRRQVLAACFLPAVSLADRTAAASPFRDVAIVTEPHVLSRESAAAFQALLAQQPSWPGATVLLPGSKQLSPRMAWQIRELAAKGAIVLLECGLAFSDQACVQTQRRILAQVFGLRLGQPLTVASSQSPYIAFDEAHALLRPFGFTFPVSCNQGEPIARFGGATVALKKTIGRGQLVYLGAMLGPHLLASDPDAERVVARLLVRSSL